MAFNADLTWDENLCRDIQMAGRNLKNALIAGEESYQEWQSYRAGRTNTVIAAVFDPVRSEGDVAELDSAYAALHDLYNCASGASITGMVVR